MAKENPEGTRVYRVTGNAKGSWAAAANRGSEQLYARLVKEHGEGKFRLTAIRATEFTAVPEKNPGSIQSFKVRLEITVAAVH